MKMCVGGDDSGSVGNEELGELERQPNYFCLAHWNCSQTCAFTNQSLASWHDSDGQTLLLQVTEG
jgi:hypothetical protein